MTLRGGFKKCLTTYCDLLAVPLTFDPFGSKKACIDMLFSLGTTEVTHRCFSHSAPKLTYNNAAGRRKEREAVLLLLSHKTKIDTVRQSWLCD
jgi:hypothetical protein